jgi:hypothetical protein
MKVTKNLPKFKTELGLSAVVKDLKVGEAVEFEVAEINLESVRIYSYNLAKKNNIKLSCRVHDGKLYVIRKS